MLGEYYLLEYRKKITHKILELPQPEFGIDWSSYISKDLDNFLIALRQDETLVINFESEQDEESQAMVLNMNPSLYDLDYFLQHIENKGKIYHIRNYSKDQSTIETEIILERHFLYYTCKFYCDKRDVLKYMGTYGGTTINRNWFQTKFFIWEMRFITNSLKAIKEYLNVLNLSDKV